MPMQMGKFMMYNINVVSSGLSPPTGPNKEPGTHEIINIRPHSIELFCVDMPSRAITTTSFHSAITLVSSLTTESCDEGQP